MNEEKGLQEEDITADEGTEDLSSFVDLADLDELEYTGNEDVFGELGDIADLGEMPDLSLDNLSDAPEVTEEVSIPDLTAEEPEETPFHTVEPSEEISVPDLMKEEEDPIPDLLQKDDALMTGLADMPVDEEGDVPMPESDALSDDESDIPMPEMDVSDMGNDISVPEMDISDMENDIPVPVLDALSDSGSDIPIPEMGGVPDMESEIAVPEQDAMAVPDINLEDGMADSVSDVAADTSMMDSLDEMDSEAGGLILDDAVSDILAGGDGMDLGFSDGGEAAPAVEENSGSGLDSMLGGLLDNLDMGGSLAGDNPLGLEDVPDSIDSLDDLADLDELSSDTEDMLDIAGMVPEEEQQEEKEPGFLKRVFGNVVTDEIAEQERLAAEKEEEEAAKREEEEAKAKEEAAAKKEEKKAEKAAKKEEKKKQKEAKKAEKAAAKEEKKKQKEEEEAAELEVVGKLNKVGVSIIVIATILFLAVEIAGTNVFGYISTKNKAVDYFEMGKYTQAYQEAVGTNMSEKDKEEYDRIKVVMKVQQALNAYQNYDRVNYYPEALDALLRGLKRYDANIDKGIELEVDSDMMSCRKQILTLLQSEFNLSESDAYSILALDAEKYQKKVVELGLKKK